MLSQVTVAVMRRYYVLGSPVKAWAATLYQKRHCMEGFYTQNVMFVPVVIADAIYMVL